MALIRATSGSGGSGGQSKSGTFNVSAGQWNGDTLGFQAKKLYINMDSPNDYTGFCVYDEELNYRKYAYKGSVYYEKTFSDSCHITSTGFEIKNYLGSATFTCHYLAEG